MRALVVTVYNTTEAYQAVVFIGGLLIAIVCVEHCREYARHVCCLFTFYVDTTIGWCVAEFLDKHAFWIDGASILKSNRYLLVNACSANAPFSVWSFSTLILCCFNLFCSNVTAVIAMFTEDGRGYMALSSRCNFILGSGKQFDVW